MDINKYISNQFKKPSGIPGKFSTFLMNKINTLQYRGIIDNLNPNENEKILDVGFGNGFLLNYLCKKYKSNFYGIDISKDMLNLATKDLSKFIESNRVNLKVGSVSNIPYDDNLFDKVYTVNTLYFWENIEIAFKEIHRVLKTNGLFFNVFYSKDWLDKISYTDYGFTKLTLDEIKAITTSNGFNIVEIIELKSDNSYCLVTEKVTP